MTKSFHVHVNPCLEFMNAILLTSRYNELTEPYVGYGLMTDEFNVYTRALKTLLRPFESEPIYGFIENMIPNGFTFSRPVELMLSLGNSDDFKIRFPLSTLCVQYCGGIDQIETLLSMLSIFEKKVGFFEYFNSIKSFYNPILNKVSETLLVYPYINLIEEQFGSEQNSYNYVISALMKGNYGIRFVDNRSLKADIFSVFTTDSFSLSPAILFHEYSHSFINPLTDKYLDLVQTHADVYEKLKKYKLPDFKSGYGDFTECVNEHFVRAMVIHLLKKIKQQERASELLQNDLYRGYQFIPEIIKRYEYYDANRAVYKDFDSFFSELLNVFQIGLI